MRHLSLTMNESATEQKLALKEVTKSDRPILEQLLQSYLEEFSQFSHQTKDRSGRFIYPYLNYYWQDPDRHPFFIKKGDQICGFALIRVERDPKTIEKTMELAEFFITKPFRRQGWGRRAAQLTWDLFPYYWKVAVMVENKKALPFWANAITDYTHNQYEVIQFGRKDFITYTFLSRALVSL